MKSRTTDKPSQPYRQIDPSRITLEQLKYMRYIIRRFRGVLPDIADFYFGKRNRVKDIKNLIARLGLLPYLNGVRLIFGTEIYNRQPNYAVFVHKMKDCGKDEVEIAINNLYRLNEILTGENKETEGS